VFLPRYTPSTSADIVRSFSANTLYTIADPETHRLSDPFAERGRGRHHNPYLQESNPRANRQRFVNAVLEAQAGADATLLVSPWLTHGTRRGTAHIRATLRFAELAADHELVEDHELLYGLAVTEEVLADDEERGDLLDDLVDLPEGHIYLRVQVTPPTSFGQYAAPPVLRGLREFVLALAAYDRSTFLPQMGLAGWLFIPDGVLASGSGVSASLQRFVAPTSGFGRPLEWYFLPQILGFVLRSEVTEIDEVQGFEPCECPYCTDLTFGTGAGWSRDAAGLHYLWWCARLAHELQVAPSAADALQEHLARAQAFWSEIQAAGVVLDERSVPRHLAVWTAVTA
jgi:hypothetical protein